MGRDTETEGNDDSADLDAKLTEAHYNLAFGYLRLGDLELATEAAQAALELNQGYPPVLTLLELIKQKHFVSGLTSSKENKISEGIRAFQFAVTIDPTFVDAYCEIGRAYLKQGDLKAAEAAIAEALQIDSNCPSARELLGKVRHVYCVRGKIYLEENLFNEALLAFKYAVEIDSSSTEALCGIGSVYLKQGNLNAAERAVADALRLDSGCSFVHKLLEEIKDAYYDRGFNFLNQGLYEEAITCFESLLAMDVDFTEAYCGLALAYLGQGELAAAEEAVSEVLLFNANYRYESDCDLLEELKRSYYERGITFLEQDRYKEAITCFENVITIDASFIGAYGELGSAHLGLQSVYLRQLNIVEEDTEEIDVVEGVKERITLSVLSDKLIMDTACPVDEIEPPWSTYRWSDQGTLKSQLRSVGRFLLLTRAEEVEVAKRIEAGKTEDGYTEDAEQARDQLVQANLRFVISVARKYQGRNVPLEDLIQEGNIGLIKAANKFDYRRGHRFSSYATWWVRNAIVHALDNSSRSIRLPSYFIARMKKFDDAYATLHQKLHREPYREEIAEALDLTVRQVEEILMSKVDTISIDLPLGDERFAEILSDLIEGSTTGEQEEPIAEMITEDLVVCLLKELSEREQKVLRMRFGLKDGKPKTLREVSIVLEVTRERVRQIEVAAIKKLRVFYDEMAEFQSE